MSASATAEDQQPRQQQDGDELSPVQRDQALNTVLTYTFLKVMMDCSTISVWPLLLKDLYAGDVALAAAAAATTSSICGLVELVVTPAVGKLSDRFGRRLFFLIGPIANVLVSLLQIRFQRSVAVAFVQRIVGQSLSTLSGTTISSATISVRKCVFLRASLYLNLITLPRQARDKHRKSWKKGDVSASAGRCERRQALTVSWWHGLIDRTGDLRWCVRACRTETKLDVAIMLLVPPCRTIRLAFRTRITGVPGAPCPGGTLLVLFCCRAGHSRAGDHAVPDRAAHYRRICDTRRNLRYINREKRRCLCVLVSQSAGGFKRSFVKTGSGQTQEVN
jgi:hypothetical protein